MADHASPLLRIVLSEDRALRDTALTEVCAPLGIDELLAECVALDEFRLRNDNLYHRVRATFFLAAIHRYELPSREGLPREGQLPFAGYEHLLARRFEEAVAAFTQAQSEQGPSEAVSSGLAAAYRGRAFQVLADQVRRSVRSVRGNQWMFRIGHPADLPLRLRRELFDRELDGPFPVLRERTPVRLDLTHSAWSDIFFLGMDYPEGARVLNLSVDLAVRGRDAEPEPPIEACLRVVDEPVIRLTSVDLDATVDLRRVREVFDFARDYLGLLRAGVIAAGLVPAGLEGSGGSLEPLLEPLCGPGRGLELVTRVRDIPKGSRLAVSTNLLASIISVCMRATGQTVSLTGPLEESERRTVAARAILGEWIGGSGGGWQDSGGVWPGLKAIEGCLAAEGDPEFGKSRGRLLPQHRLLQSPEIPQRTFELLQRCLVPLHGGMAQDVGPILDMVTEKYLLREADAWRGRLRALEIYDQVQVALRDGDIRALAKLTTDNFFGPLQRIVPWATNRFTERLIERVREELGEHYLGFLMLGGMSGGGMAFWIDPDAEDSARDRIAEILLEVKREHEPALPFAMDPVVYDFGVNPHGTAAELLSGSAARMHSSYYALMVPQLLRQSGGSQLSLTRRRELERLGGEGWSSTELQEFLPTLFDRLLPRAPIERRSSGQTLEELLDAAGFDRELHERIRTDLRAGRIGLAQNRLPITTTLEDVEPSDVILARDDLPEVWRSRGRAAIARGEAAVVTLAAGAASRWTRGAGVAKALTPFCRLGGAHRSFLDVHLAKTRRVMRELGAQIPHVVTTSLFTHDAIEAELSAGLRDQHEGLLLTSPGRSVGLRFVPPARDLVFLFEETAQQLLDEQAQKVRESLHSALLDWARAQGEASDYTDNLPLQCLHPTGHWFEIPNMLRNGVLADLFRQQPSLRYLLVHNVDTVGADLDPARLGLHIERGAALSFEVIPRRIDDVGGGLARVDGRPRLVEGLAMPDEAAEFRMAYYNTGTCWVDLHRLLELLGLSREDLDDQARVATAIRRLAARMPTYVTIKDVKKRWGRAQEDVYPVAQFEKLWGDMTLLPELNIQYHVVPRMRGQQLKEPAQLDAFVRDGSAAYVESLCAF